MSHGHASLCTALCVLNVKVGPVRWAVWRIRGNPQRGGTEGWFFFSMTKQLRWPQGIIVTSHHQEITLKSDVQWNDILHYLIVQQRGANQLSDLYYNSDITVAKDHNYQMFYLQLSKKGWQNKWSIVQDNTKYTLNAHMAFLLHARSMNKLQLEVV